MPTLAFMALLLLCAGLPALAVICLLPLGFALAFFVICLPFTAVAALAEPPALTAPIDPPYKLMQIKPWHHVALYSIPAAIVLLTLLTH